MINKSSQPIGIFDSGSGGLNVTQSVAHLLPYEDIIYFGDTAHAPWGDKSQVAIQGYAIRICELLLKHQCKCILLACHTASAVAFERVKEYVGDRAAVFNVIEPLMNHLGAHYDQQTIGLIGTKQTVRSNIYQKKFDALPRLLALKTLATPLLVPLIEEGFINEPATQLILEHYLNNPALSDIEALILGCTHYPFLSKQIAACRPELTLIDTSTIVAEHLAQYLAHNDLLQQMRKPRRLFYVSDYNEFFLETVKRFFASDILIEPYPLWD